MDAREVRLAPLFEDLDKRALERVALLAETLDVDEGKEIVTHIIPLISADAVRLVQELAPLFPPTGPTRITSNGDTNSLVGSVEKLSEWLASSMI